jgi:hypothetical protein
MESEVYAAERKAEFLLNNALNADEYRWAVRESLLLGVDPTHLEHLFHDNEWQDPSRYLPEIAMEALRSRHA